MKRRRPSSDTQNRKKRNGLESDVVKPPPSKPKKNKYLIYMQTAQLSKLRIIFDSVKDLVDDVNIKFFKEDHPAHGMELFCTDAIGACCLYLQFPAREIKQSGVFECTRDLMVSVHVSDLHGIIRLLKSHESITFSVRRDDGCHLYIHAHQTGTGIVEKYKIRLIELNDNRSTLSDYVTNYVRYVDAEKFRDIVHRIIMSVNCKLIEFKKDSKGRMIIIGRGDNAESNVPIPDLPLHADEKVVESTQPTRPNIFDVRWVSVAIKPYSVCEQIKLCIVNEMALILEYHLVSLGRLRFFIACSITDQDEAV